MIDYNEIIASFEPKEPSLSPGWISPQGVFWPCNYWQHDLVAEKIYPEDGARRLEKERWIRLNFDGSFRVGDDSSLTEPVLTQSQLDTLFDISQSPQNDSADKSMAETISRWLENCEIKNEF